MVCIGGGPYCRPIGRDIYSACWRSGVRVKLRSNDQEMVGGVAFNYHHSENIKIVVCYRGCSRNVEPFEMILVGGGIC